MSKSTEKANLVSEGSFQFTATFLSDYWKSRPLTEIESSNTYLLFLLKRSLSTLMTVPATAFASIVSVTGALIVLSLFLFFDTNLRRLLDQVGTSNQGIIYFSEDAKDQDILAVKTVLNEIGGLDHKYVSKEEALKLFIEDLGSRKDLISGLEENPLPRSLEFKVMDQNDAKKIEFIKSKFSDAKSLNLSGVEEVAFGAPWAKSAEKLRIGVLQVSLSVLSIVILVVVFLVSNVIKLMLFGQKEEIEIMQLVGASSERISAPYLLSGGILGLTGAIAAIVLSFIIYFVFLKPLNSYLLFGVSYQVFTFLTLGNIGFILLSGLFLGVSGSYLAIKKWMVK